MANATIEQQLRNAVSEMDSLSQGGFSEIAVIARMALAAMENPRMCTNLDFIAIALTAIWNKAEDVENSINATAEGVGCNYRDDARRRRWDALRQAREEGRA